jgi:hypothetical protein
MPSNNNNNNNDNYYVTSLKSYLNAKQGQHGGTYCLRPTMLTLLT